MRRYEKLLTILLLAATVISGIAAFCGIASFCFNRRSVMLLQDCIVMVFISFVLWDLYDRCGREPGFWSGFFGTVLKILAIPCMLFLLIACKGMIADAFIVNLKAGT